MTRAEWVAAVKKQHGIITRWPANVEPGSNAGKLAARYGARHYVLAPLSVRLADNIASGGDSQAIVDGSVFTPLENAGDAALKKGALGLLAAGLGVPEWLLLVILLAVLYLILRNMGLVGSR